MDSRLLWLALGGFAGGLEGFLIGSLLPGISADLGVTVGLAGLAVTVYALAHGFGTPVLAALFGGVHRHKLLAGAELTFASAAVLIALAPHFGWLMLARILLALGAGLYSATAMATAIAVSPPEHRGRAIGIVVAGQSLALLVGVPTGAWVAANYGWRPAYLAIAMLGLAAAAAMYLRLPRGIAGDTRTLRERVGALRIPGIPMALLTTAIFMISAYLPIIYIAPLSAYAAGVGRDMLPLILLANGIGAFAGGNLGGRIADRLGTRPAILLATAGQLAVLAALVIVPSLPDGARFPAFLLAMGVAGFVGWAFWPAQSSRVAGLSPPAAPLTLALNGTALNIGVALCATIGGATIDRLGAAAIAPIGVPFALITIALAALYRPAAAR